MSENNWISSINFSCNLHKNLTARLYEIIKEKVPSFSFLCKDTWYSPNPNYHTLLSTLYPKNLHHQDLPERWCAVQTMKVTTRSLERGMRRRLGSFLRHFPGLSQQSGTLTTSWEHFCRAPAFNELCTSISAPCPWASEKEMLITKFLSLYVCTSEISE